MTTLIVLIVTVPIFLVVGSLMFDPDNNDGM